MITYVYMNLYVVVSQLSEASLHLCYDELCVMYPLTSSHVCVFRPVDISVPGLCWAADAKLAGGGGSPWRHDSSSPAGGFAVAASEKSSAGFPLVNLGYYWK